MVSIITLLTTISSISIMANSKSVNAAYIGDKLLSRVDESAFKPFPTTTESESPTTSGYTSFPTAPVVSGAIVDGSPEWTILISGKLGPLEGIDLELTTGSGPFEYSYATIAIDGIEVPVYVDDSETLTVIYSNDIAESSEAVITFGGVFYDRGTASAAGTIALTFSGEIEPEVITFPILFNIDSNGNTYIDPEYPFETTSSESTQPTVTITTDSSSTDSSSTDSSSIVTKY